MTISAVASAGSIDGLIQGLLKISQGAVPVNDLAGLLAADSHQCIPGVDTLLADAGTVSRPLILEVDGREETDQVLADGV